MTYADSSNIVLLLHIWVFYIIKNIKIIWCSGPNYELCNCIISEIRKITSIKLIEHWTEVEHKPEIEMPAIVDFMLVASIPTNCAPSWKQCWLCIYGHFHLPEPATFTSRYIGAHDRQLWIGRAHEQVKDPKKHLKIEHIKKNCVFNMRENNFYYQISVKLF